jgi:hypothetical protein
MAVGRQLDVRGGLGARAAALGGQCVIVDAWEQHPNGS